jgi:transcriptional regulator with XRE-family HTH domain
MMSTVEDRSPGRLLKEARLRRGVSQKRLAIRAGTTQSAISRIENDQISPTVETLRGLLHMLGEDLAMDAVERDAGIDRELTRANLADPHDARFRRAMEFSDFVREHLPGTPHVA